MNYGEVEVTKDNVVTAGKADKIIKWLSVMTGIFAILQLFTNAIIYFLNYNYSKEAEAFYGIPCRYFVDSTFDDKIMYFIFLGACLLLLGLPFIYKNLFKINRFGILESVLYSLCVTVLMSSVVILSIIKIISIFNLEAKGELVLILTGIIAIITFGIYMYLFLKDFSKVRKKDLEKQENIIKEEKAKEENDKDAKKKKRSTTKEVVESGNHEKEGDSVEENKSSEESIVLKNGVTKRLSTWFIGFIKELPTIILAAVLTFVVLSPFFITSDRIVEIPQNKTKYELVTINEGDKGNKRDMAVVSYKNGKAVLMDCTIIRQVTMDGKEIENLLLTKGKYRLIDIEGYQIEYKEFNAVKCE